MGAATSSCRPPRVFICSAEASMGLRSFPPSRRGTQNLVNPNPYTWTFRALLADMDAWVRKGDGAAAIEISSRRGARIGAAGRREVPEDPRRCLPHDHPPGVPIQLRSGFPHQRHRHAGTARNRSAVSSAGTPSGPGWSRYRRHPHARDCGSARHLYRLESASPGNRCAENARHEAVRSSHLPAPRPSA